MSQVNQERVLSVHHWNDSLFSFTTTRSPSLRFRNGHFVMIGLEVEGRPLLRAFSFASANYDEHLEFYSIKVPDGPLTSRLRHIQPGDPILIGRKADRDVVARSPAARQAALPAGQRHRPCAVHEPDPRPRDL